MLANNKGSMVIIKRIVKKGTDSAQQQIHKKCRFQDDSEVITVRRGIRMSNKNSGISRRSFLKGLGAAGGAVLLPVRETAVAAGSSDEELCTLLDLSKCIGCGECVSACHEANEHKFPKPDKPYPEMYPKSRVKIEDWSGRRDVDDRLTPYNWLYIQSAEVEFNGEIHEVNIPRRCLHCRNAPCANLCPWGAAGKQKNGIVRINEEVCLGGAKCRAVCPWHIPQRQTGVGLYLRLLPILPETGSCTSVTAAMTA